MASRQAPSSSSSLTSSITSSITITSTTIPSAASASTSSAKSGSSSHVSSGALAGAAVGCAIGGLIFGFAAAWLLLSRRWKKSHNGSGGLAGVESSLEPKSVDGQPTVANGHSTIGVQLDKFILSATPESQIGTELQSLGDLIQQHVENHYHLGQTLASTAVLSEGLVKLGFKPGAGNSADAAAVLCARPESRHIGIRHVISEVVFRSIDVHSRSRLSMLPTPVAAFLQSMPSEDPSTKTPAMSLALSQWRQLSALLLHPTPVDRTPLPISDSVASGQALALATALNTFLHYFVAPNEVGLREQTSHLQAVIVECTKFGYVLFSHPSDFQFVFNGDGAGTRQSGVTVCAGLDKLTPGDGHRNLSPRRVVEPLLVST